MKLIFVTGGVVSSLGKGIVTASLASLLRARGIKLKIRKLDPYLNVDPGTMSPYQHGEVYVTDDGYETDLDLGHYERFTDIKCSKNDSISSGKIYSTILSKERKGKYLGSTVQVIPHVTEEIKNETSLKSEKIDLNVIYEDEDLIVIDKPAGIVMHPGAGNKSGTIVNALINHCGNSLKFVGESQRPGIVHRIDKDTSGLVVVAKNDFSHQHLSLQFADHSIRREYFAVCWGIIKPANGKISSFITRSNKNRTCLLYTSDAADE